MNGSENLSFQQGLAEVLINMEKDYLTITTSYTNLIIGNCYDALDALSTDVLGENQDLVLNLEAAEVA